jgi:hypothetical protein
MGMVFAAQEGESAAISMSIFAVQLPQTKLFSFDN